MFTNLKFKFRNENYINPRQGKTLRVVSRYKNKATEKPPFPSPVNHDERGGGELNEKPEDTPEESTKISEPEKPTSQKHKTTASFPHQKQKEHSF